MPEPYINFNGSFFQKDSTVIRSNNRAFCYGDGIFETIHSSGSVIQHFDDHYQRIISSLKVLKIDVPPHFTKDFLEQQIIKTLTKNRVFKGGRVRLSIYRKEGGLYTPAQNEPEFLVDTTTFEYDQYSLNQQGWEIGIYSDIKKPINILSNLKTSNSLPFVMAALYRKEQALNDVLLLNENDHLVESSSSNIFIVIKDTLITPPLSDGCIDGVMRKQIIKCAKELNINVEENKSLSPDILAHAEEIFLTNAISGIRWVVAYNNKRYYNKLAKKLLNKLNEISFEK